MIKVKKKFNFYEIRWREFQLNHLKSQLNRLKSQLNLS